MISDLPSIVFFGTPKLSVYTLKYLYEHGFPIEAVVTKPDTTAGRNRKPQYPPVKIFAKRKSLQIFQPSTLRNKDFQNQIKELNPDYFVVVAFGKILPDSLLKIPKKEALNIHFSLLPKYRGASPVTTSILNGDSECGVSIIQVAKKLDSGDIFYLVKDTISPDENTCDVEDKLIRKGTDALVHVLKNFDDLEQLKIKQDEDKVIYASMIKKEDGLIDWTKSARKIWCEIRAYNPWPWAHTYYKDLYIKLIKGEPMNQTYPDHKPGTVVGLVPKFGFIISCGEGSLLIKELQPANKRKMTALDFINGYHLQIGDQFK